jgi:hypothetical protein
MGSLASPQTTWRPGAEDEGVSYVSELQKPGHMAPRFGLLYRNSMEVAMTAQSIAAGEGGAGGLPPPPKKKHFPQGEMAGRVVHIGGFREPRCVEWQCALHATPSAQRPLTCTAQRRLSPRGIMYLHKPALPQKGDLLHLTFAESPCDRAERARGACLPWDCTRGRK